MFDPGLPRRALVAAEGVGVASQPRLVQQEPAGEIGQSDQHDRRRDAENLEVVDNIDERAAHDYRIGIGQADGETAHPDPGGQRDDQRVDTEPHHEEGVEQLDRQRNAERGEQPNDDVSRRREDEGEGDAAQRDQRSRREIDVAGDDGEGRADGDDGQRRVLLQQALHVGDSEKPRVDDGEGDHQEREHQQ